MDGAHCENCIKLYTYDLCISKSLFFKFLADLILGNISSVLLAKCLKQTQWFPDSYPSSPDVRLRGPSGPLKKRPCELILKGEPHNTTHTQGHPTFPPTMGPTPNLQELTQIGCSSHASPPPQLGGGMYPVDSSKDPWFYLSPTIPPLHPLWWRPSVSSLIFSIICRDSRRKWVIKSIKG